MNAFQKKYSHTPGPWRVATNKRSVLLGDSIKLNQLTGPGGQSCSSQYANDQILQANARLLAASLDLLSMLKRIVRSGSPTLDGHTYPVQESLLKEAAELISRLE